MKIITVVNDDGVERRIEKGALPGLRRAGFKPKGETAEKNAAKDTDADDAAAQAQSKAKHPSSKPAKGKDKTTPDGDAAN